MVSTYTTSNTFTELTPNCGIKEIMVASPSGETTNGDILQVTLPNYGISATGLLTIEGFVQTTAASIVATEEPTTSVSAGVLSITSGAGSGKKFYRILGKSN